MEMSNKMELNEKIDMYRAKKCLYNFKTLFSEGKLNAYDNNFKYVQDELTAYTIFYNFLNQKIKSSTIKYKFQLGDKGRKMTDHGYVGLINLARPFRHTIARDLYWDFDIKNAFPTILLTLARNMNVEMPTFVDYVNNRDKYLRILMNNPFNFNRDEAKKYALKILHFGKPYNELMRNYRETAFDKIEWLSYMEMEIEDFFDALVKTQYGLELYEAAKKSKADNKNIKGTTMSYVFGIEENKILEVMCYSFRLQGFEIATYCYDGCIVYQQGVKPDLIQTEKQVKELTNYDIKLEEKIMDEGFDLDEYPDPPEDWTGQLVIERTDKYVRKSDYVSTEKIIVVKANLGSGKTTAIIEHIKDCNYDIIICLGSRITFTRDLEKRMKDNKLGFVHYQDRKGFLKENKIIIQVESLSRLHPDIIRGCDLLLIDECESVLTQMTSYSTHKKKHLENINIFTSLMMNVKKIIMMDGYISNITTHFLCDMGLGKYQYYDYITHNYNRKYDIIPHFDNWVNDIIKNVIEGKKICVFTTSKMKAKTLSESFLKQGIEHLLYDSDNRSKINTNDWINEKIRVVIYTSTITVGVNFDTKGVFDRMYCYLSSMSRNRIRDVFQALFRIREFNENLVLFNFNENLVGLTTNNTPTNRNGVIRLFNENQEMRSVILSLISRSEYEKYLNVSNAFKNLCVNCRVEENKSIMCLEEELMRFLTLSNYSKLETEVETSSSLVTDYNEEIVKFEYNPENWKFDEINSITDNEYKTMKHKKDNFTLEDLKILKKHEFTKYIDYVRSEKPSNLFKLYVSGGCRVNNIRKERNTLFNKEDACDEILNKVSCLTTSGVIEKLVVINELKTELGIKDTQKPTIVTVDNVKKGLDWVDEGKILLYNVFGIRDQRKEGVKYTDICLSDKAKMGLLNKILDEWGYSQIKPKYRTKKERKEDIVGYELVEAGIEGFIKQKVDVPVFKTESSLKRTEIELDYLDGFDFLEF